MRVRFVPGFVILLTVASAPAQQQSARELFYAATPAQAQPKPAATAPTKPVVKAKPTTPAPKMDANATPPSAPVDSAYPGGTPGGPPHSGPITEGNVLPGGAHVMRASSQTGPALGLRYSIMRLVNGRMIETPQDYVFHAGDHFQVNVQANTPGYLYVVSQGSSGAWSPIFPSPKIANGDNHVDGFHTYTLPTPDYQIGFDERTGTENLTIVFSRQPVPDFEDLIYSLQDRQSQPAGEAQPAGQPPMKKMISLANVHIDDATLGRLRNASTRDLIVEHVDASTPADAGTNGDRKETAVYVVNPTGGSDSRLIADLHLVHK